MLVVCGSWIAIEADRRVVGVVIGDTVGVAISVGDDVIGAGDGGVLAVGPDELFAPTPGINASANTTAPSAPEHTRAQLGKCGITTFTKSPAPRIASPMKIRPPMINATCAFM